MSVKSSLKSFLLRTKLLYIRPLFDRDSRAANLLIVNIRKYLSINDIGIVFYDRIPAHYSFTRGIIDEVIKDQKVILIVGDKDHPLLTGKDSNNLKVFYLSQRFEFLLGRLGCKVLVTFASSLTSLVKPSKIRFVHMFHSLASLHYIYNDYEFDTYDIFFAAGPHHKREIERISRLRGWKGKDVFEVGYNKVDDLSSALLGGAEVESKPVIILAPSWGENNLLRLFGVEIVHLILKNGYKVIVRPHPHSFEHDVDVISELQSIAMKFPDLCSIEKSAPGNESLLRSDIMISDWSGVAYEYAFGTGNPVIFLDVPRKINSKKLREIDLPAMEDICRTVIGEVSTIQAFEAALISMVAKHKQWRKTIEMARQNYLYNFGHSAKVAAKIINDLISF